MFFNITWCVSENCEKKNDCWRYCISDEAFIERSKLGYYSIADFNCIDLDNPYKYFIDKNVVQERGGKDVL